jgi:hypothetical protein
MYGIIRRMAESLEYPLDMWAYNESLPSSIEL